MYHIISKRLQFTYQSTGVEWDLAWHNKQIKKEVLKYLERAYPTGDHNFTFAAIMKLRKQCKAPPPPPPGGGGHFHIDGNGDVPLDRVYDFAVITIDTGLSQGCFPAHNVYDRPAISAPATVRAGRNRFL